MRGPPPRPQRFSPTEQAAFVTAAVAAEPAGLLCTVPDAGAVEAPLREAIDAGIPVIAVNAADPRPAGERIPYLLLYIGADDISGGGAVAARMLASGPPSRALCVDHYLVDNACHNARCSGFRGSLRDAGVPTEKLRVPGDDLSAVTEQIGAYVAEHPDLDCICTLGPPGCAATIEALQASGRLGSVSHGSFDLAPAQLDAVAAGRPTFTVDSQQYLQGFIGIAMLWLYSTQGLLSAGNVLTGPRFVDGQNVERVRAGVAAGIR